MEALSLSPFCRDWPPGLLKWHPTPVLSPGKSHGRRAWWTAVHEVAKSRTRLSDFTFTSTFKGVKVLSLDFLELCDFCFCCLWPCCDVYHARLASLMKRDRKHSRKGTAVSPGSAGSPEMPHTISAEPCLDHQHRSIMRNQLPSWAVTFSKSYLLLRLYWDTAG